MPTKYTLLIDKKPEFVLRHAQSPRGLRVKDRRPNEVIVQVDELFNYKQLNEHIAYLLTLTSSMDITER